MQSNNNILIAQGGGPTNVINQSLVGIINGEKNKNSNIIGAINGVRGIIDNNFIKLSKFNNVNLKKFKIHLVPPLVQLEINLMKNTVMKYLRF